MGGFDDTGRELLFALKPDSLSGMTKKGFNMIMHQFNKDNFKYPSFEVYEEQVSYEKKGLKIDNKMCFSDWWYVINMMPEPLKVIDEQGKVMMLSYKEIGVFNWNKRAFKVYAEEDKK